MSLKALERHLEPLMPFLEMDEVTEICINQPREVFIERGGMFERREVDELEYDCLYTLAGLVAELNSKDYPAPLIEGSLLNGERAQFVLQPACESGKIICSIRRHRMKQMTLVDYEERGAFSNLSNKSKRGNFNDQLHKLYQEQNYMQFIKEAIHTRKNILICGGTGTGKTTFLNACLKEIAEHERLITVEDTREVIIGQPNKVNLLFNENDTAINAQQIFKACLRLRPDRIFLSELRGAEVWSYLRAANSGHPGSITTVHADSVEGAFTQLVFMMQQARSTSTEEQLRSYIQSIIHIVVKLKRDPEKFVVVEDVWFANK